jgi:hypothetical protein
MFEFGGPAAADPPKRVRIKLTHYRELTTGKLHVFSARSDSHASMPSERRPRIVTRA